MTESALSGKARSTMLVTERLSTRKHLAQELVKSLELEEKDLLDQILGLSENDALAMLAARDVVGIYIDAKLLAYIRHKANEPKRCVDHSLGLCSNPDVPNDTPREDLEQNPAHCICCGSDMQIVEMDSLGMQQAGMYRLICTTCPA